jgi:hypothetical protein
MDRLARYGISTSNGLLTEKIQRLRELTTVMVLRCMAAIIAGMIVALVFVVAVELFSAVVHPVPPDFQGTMEEMCLQLER